jgi:exopolysaccharide biosynthesis predicted pyruvyltransferase EpsI
VGDSAIWLGEIALFREVKGRLPSYTSHRHSFDEQELSAALPRGPIFIHGGGNFGDLYPEHQSLRHKVIAAFPDRLVVQMPQSIFYSADRDVDETAKLIRSHRNFHLLVRERPSLALASANFDCPSEFIPDGALGWGVLRPRQTASHSAIFLLRTDIDTRRNVISNMLASFRLGRGLKVLSSGRAVLTDRLHRHILTFLLRDRLENRGVGFCGEAIYDSSSGCGSSRAAGEWPRSPRKPSATHPI